jgi:hypothetical protein
VHPGGIEGIEANGGLESSAEQSPHTEVRDALDVKEDREAIKKDEYARKDQQSPASESEQILVEEKVGHGVDFGASSAPTNKPIIFLDLGLFFSPKWIAWADYPVSMLSSPEGRVKSLTEKSWSKINKICPLG